MGKCFLYFHLLTASKVLLVQSACLFKPVSSRLLSGDSERNWTCCTLVIVFLFHWQVCSGQRVLGYRPRARARRAGPVWGGSLRAGQVLGGGQAARRLQKAVHQQPLQGRLPRQEAQEGVSWEAFSPPSSRMCYILLFFQWRKDRRFMFNVT